MRVRTSLILDEALLAQIDEIAGEKQRRAAITETNEWQVSCKGGRPTLTAQL